MKTQVARSMLIVAIVAFVAACGGGGAPGATSGNPPVATQKPAGGGGAGDVDCAAIRAAAEQLIGIQLLAQLSTPESLESIKSVGNLDLDAMLSALDELHALDGVASPLGDAKASIDFYQKAAKAAKALFAMDPVTQAAIDAYNKDNVGSIGDFLGKQMAISGAIGEADC